MSVRAWAVFGAAAVAMAMAACSDDGGSMGGEASMPAPAPTASTQQSLYERLGKKEGIAKAVDAIVQEELKDTEIASFFFFQVQEPIPAGHPSAAQIEECLTLQLSAAAGGPETYPATVSGGFTCRSMTAAHKGLGIPSGVFDRFVMIAASVLKSAGVADADIKVVGDVLVGAKTAVAQDTTRETGSFVPPTTN